MGMVSKHHKSTSSSLLHTREVEDTGMALERHLHVCYMRGRWRRSRYLRQVYTLVLHGRGLHSTVGNHLYWQGFSILHRVVQPCVGLFNCVFGPSPLGHSKFHWAVQLCVGQAFRLAFALGSTGANSRESREGVAGTSKRAGASMAICTVKEQHYFWGV